MAGLFGVDSPEDIRARIGATGRQEDLQLASLPAGRGIVALNSQLGRGAVQGAGQLLGFQGEADVKAQKNQAIGLKIDSLSKEQGINRKDNPIEFASLSAQVLLEGGETQAAGNALKMANSLKSLTATTDTALTKEVMTVFGLKNKEQIAKDPKARAFMQMAVTAKNNRQSTVPAPANTEPTKSELLNMAGLLTAKIENTPIKLGGKTFTQDDFTDPKNFGSFVRAVASLSKQKTGVNKQGKQTPLNMTRINDESYKALSKYIVQEKNRFSPDEVFFDEQAYLGDFKANTAEQVGGSASASGQDSTTGTSRVQYSEFF